MRNLRKSEFERLVEGAKVLEADARGPRVYLTHDGKVVKLFPQKGWFSSNRVRPYALRFAQNARRLAKQGIQTVKVDRVGRCRELGLHFVVYPLLPGSTLRALIDDPNVLQASLEALADFLCRLHEQGIYFKAFHLGNVLRTPDEGLALIDIQSMRFYTRPVPLKARHKNFLVCLRYTQDYTLLKHFGFEAFFRQYLRCSSLNPVQATELLDKLSASLPGPELNQALQHCYPS